MATDNDGEVKIGTDIDESGLKKGVSKISTFVKNGAKAAVELTAKTVATVGTASAAAAGALVKSATESYAEYEQLVGGVETLFKDSSEIVENYASQAYQTAGISANDYMESVTSFTASLLQSLNGDTEKAAESANQAIIDMSDNANKMGTSMESIQNAYQGFAKQNYTMLDNLKLGYGGTKEEMQRLLADAEAFSGIKYDINNLDDVYNAIHVIQGELGISGRTAEEAAEIIARTGRSAEEVYEQLGTTAKEGSTTIEGSVNAAKAAWSNLVVGIADDTQDFDALVSNFVNSVVTAADNILPRVRIAISGVGKLVSELLPVILKEIPVLLGEVAPEFIKAVGEMTSQVITSLVEYMPQFAQMGMNFLISFIDGITEKTPDCMSAFSEILINILNGIAESLPMLIQKGSEMIAAILEGIIPYLPDVAAAGVNIISNLCIGIAKSISDLIPVALDLINVIADTIVEQTPVILDAGFEILSAVIAGIVGNIGNLVDTAVDVVLKLAEAFIDNFDKFVSIGFKLIFQLISGLIRALPDLLAAVIKLINELVNVFFSYDWNGLGVTIIKALISGLIDMSLALWDACVELGKMILEAFGIPDLYDTGKNLIKGLWNGIKSMGSWIKKKISGFGDTIVSAFKSVFGIKSPSRVLKKEVGVYLPQGIEAGIEEDEPKLIATSEKMASDTIETIKKATVPDDVEIIGRMQSRAYGYINESAQAKLEVVKDTIDNNYKDNYSGYEIDYDRMAEANAKALENTEFKVGDREFARLVRKVVPT